MMVPDMFAALLRHVDVRLDHVLAALTEAEIGQGSFRSELNPPTTARLHLANARRAKLPDALPYVAGRRHEDMLDIGSIVLHPNMIWYRDGNTQAHLVVRKVGGKLPNTIMMSLPGRRVSQIVQHPILAEIDPVIEAANGNAATITLRIASRWTPLEADAEHMADVRA